MPKRTTLLYTSADAPKTEDNQLYVYYCKYSGRHAFTTDVDIETLPRRRTDGARIFDQSQHTIKTYLTDGGVKLLRRADGSIERQHRLNMGSLPVAYTSEPDGNLLYIMDKAVTSYQRDGADRIPVPPCIRLGESGSTEITLEIEDKQAHAAIAKITADCVRVHLTSNASHEVAAQELLALLARTLTMRLTQLTLVRGSSPRHKVCVVEMLSPRQVYHRLRGLGPKHGQRQEEQGGRKKRPWHAGL